MPVTETSRQREDFRALVRDQLPRLYALARVLVGSEAEDAVQDCMVKALEHYEQLHDPGAGAAWLKTILVNCCHDRLRARARQPEPVDFDDREAEGFSLYRKIAYEDPFPYSDSVHLDFLYGFSRDDVRAVLLALPDIYRIPLVLVHMEGYLAKETATLLQVPLGTVLSRLQRGRKAFEKGMWDYAQTHGLLKEGVR
ncbi:RNA polymerase sigma factor [Streptomyces luteolifulvus]|jgi:RNA polymerase sigma-70 factor (ECF subfamily)|uniref:RNA polymerase sigma factor n=1 Tax=Streptomyces luteolifulvus TaxID=2615112 RepID=A0A6H9V224_9ACTN|nr:MULTISPECIES: RNA polymerase sigma factor [Streptomyces]KAB1147154.1 RNA polymerase sigma factor [Streptomyces luteolifulvus]MXM68121.1 sigma-70 family RNA polymerase sigma factor [Streptomyces sp. HUCO-GS316]